MSVLVLVSAFLHASWNALLMREEDKQLAGLAVLALSTVAATAATVLVAVTTGRSAFETPGSVGWSLAAGVFEGGYYLTLLLALGQAPLALAYTVSRGLAILLVWPLSVAFFGERVAPLAIAGTSLLVVGLAAAGLERSGGIASRRGLFFACACGAFIAAYHLCYKRALAHTRSTAAVFAVFAVSLAVALGLNFARLGGRRLPLVAAAVRARPAPLVAAGVLCAASFLTFLVALRNSGAGFILTLRNTSVLFAILLAPLTGERPTRRQIAGAALVASGAILMGLER